MARNGMLEDIAGVRYRPDIDRRVEDDEDGISAIAVIAILRRHVRAQLALIACGVLLALAVSLLRVRYVASSALMPQSNSSAASKYAGIAAQFGINFGAKSDGDTPEFYAALLSSRELLKEAAETEFSFHRTPGTSDVRKTTIVEMYGGRSSSADQRLNNSINKLRKLVDARANAKLGIVTLETSTPSPEFSVLLNRRLLELVNDFNLKRRQSQAGAERRFVEERMASAQIALSDAEQRVASFLTQNRIYRDSPQLTFEYNKLQRHVDEQQQLYTSLATAYEQARIEEVRNTPVITVLDNPEGTAVKEGSVVLNLAFGLFLGLAAGVLVALGLEFRKNAAVNQQFAAGD